MSDQLDPRRGAERPFVETARSNKLETGRRRRRRRCANNFVVNLLNLLLMRRMPEFLHCTVHCSRWDPNILTVVLILCIQHPLFIFTKIFYF